MPAPLDQISVFPSLPGSVSLTKTFLISLCVSLSLSLFHSHTCGQRFGNALVSTGQLSLKQKKYAKDLRPISETCSCPTCKAYTRAYLHQIVTREPLACHLVSVHNIAYQVLLQRVLLCAGVHLTFVSCV